MTCKQKVFVSGLAAAFLAALALGPGPGYAADKSLTPDSKPGPASPDAKPGSAAAKAVEEAAKTPYPAVQDVLKTGQTVTGGPLAFPQVNPSLHAYVVTLTPGQTTDWHMHQAPMFAYVLEGEVTVTYDGHGKEVFEAGDGLLEAIDTIHQARNTGETAARILAVVMLGDEKNATVLSSPPGNEKATIE
ncbi:hypothetical protein GCM10011316_16090 [Roseibium aquae]|uniref:Cupin type-2 domain-containing protein n=1 Tax=Roseibium aquae TaxID=1323746 RepID=A0A916WZK3_9HYPH|nr:cupin domain-containing protein [Roseibium aquae]GGB44888.1 hypothetical protein GCM10011316_16090 [Roseibium aquae]